MDLEDFENALVDINKALSLNEYHLPALNLLIEVLTEQEKYEEAEEKIDYYLKIKPLDLNALIKKIIVYTRTQRYIEAEITSSQMINIAPEFSVGYSCRSDVRRLMKNFEEALDDVFKALELDSENLQAIATLAEIYGEIGKINEFYIHFESALKINSEFMRQNIKKEEIYKKFINEERFLNLISKYDIYL